MMMLKMMEQMMYVNNQPAPVPKSGMLRPQSIRLPAGKKVFLTQLKMMMMGMNV